MDQDIHGDTIRLDFAIAARLDQPGRGLPCTEETMKGNPYALPIILWCALTLPVQAADAATTDPLLAENPPIRVLLADSMTSACVIPKVRWRASDLDGRLLADLPSDTPTTFVAVGGNILFDPGSTGTASRILGPGPVVLESPATSASLRILRVPYGVGWWWESAEDRIYSGRIEIRAGPDDRLVLVAVLPLEEYLRGVVPSEIGPDSPHEALCAQAVAARSAAVLALTTRIYGGPHHDICSDVACQAFSGLTKASAATDAAVMATRGLILVSGGKPVSAYYASNCGGHSEDIRHVWPDRANDRTYWNTAHFDGDGSTPLDLASESGMRAWLDESPPVFCNPDFAKVPEWAAKNFRWTREVTADELTSLVAAQREGLGRIIAIRPVRRGPSGRLIEAEFVGENGSLRVTPELAIRQIFKPPLKSSAFIVDSRGDTTQPEVFIIRGAGWGHGVGMCQTGAVGMANAGRKHPEILRHYYPNASLSRIY
jgi:SpoIID/LytB domain protein